MMDRDHDRRRHARADRRLRRRAAGQGRDRRRSRRAGRGMLAHATGCASPCGRSTSSAPAATGRTRSTSPRWPRWSRPRPARPWSSTAIGRPRASVERPTCSRVSAWRSRCRRRESPPPWPRSASASASPRSSTRRSGTPSGPRREMGVPTVFNFLGPLTNPAQPAAGAIGCGDARMAPVMAEVFAGRDAEVDVVVFRGDDGLDELTTTTTSSVWEVRGGEVRPGRIDPVLLGLAPASGRRAARRRRRVQRRSGPACLRRRARAGARRRGAQRRRGHRRPRRV